MIFSFFKKYAFILLMASILLNGGIVNVNLVQAQSNKQITMLNLIELTKFAGECKVLPEIFGFGLGLDADQETADEFLSFMGIDLESYADEFLSRFSKWRYTKDTKYKTDCDKALNFNREYHDEMAKNDPNGYMKHVWWAGFCEGIEDMHTFSKTPQNGDYVEDISNLSDFVIFFQKFVAKTDGINTEQLIRKCSVSKKIYQDLKKNFQNKK